MGRWRCHQSPMGERNPHKNTSQQKSFSNPEQEVQKGINMLEKTPTWSRGSGAALEGNLRVGQGQPKGLALLNLLWEPTETQTRDKKICQLDYYSLLLPRSHFCEENVPGAFFGCLQIHIPAEEPHGLLQGAVLSGRALMELQDLPSEKRSSCDPG